MKHQGTGHSASLSLVYCGRQPRPDQIYPTQYEQWLGTMPYQPLYNGGQRLVS